MSAEYCLPFSALGKDYAQLVGAKCANLGEMAKIGLPVPPGFAVTTRAYDAFLLQTGARSEIEDVLRRFPEGPTTLGECYEISKALTQIVATKKMPRETAEAIVAAYDELGRSYGTGDLSVAVRSSGVAEDLPTASFAGQYDSYLAVRGREDILEKVQACWASLFTPRAVSYLMRTQLAVLAGSMSVVVQKMVNARAAGVGFTVHPTTGDQSKIVIDGNWGLGETVVQGMVTPDRYIVDKRTGLLEGKTIGEKTRQIRLNGQETVEEEVAPDLQNEACISDGEALRIAELAQKVEAHYGAPQDFEWAVDWDASFPDNVFFLQTRPVTKVGHSKSATEQIVDLLVRRLV